MDIGEIVKPVRLVARCSVASGAGDIVGEVKIVGDIESPVVPLKNWKITRK